MLVIMSYSQPGRYTDFTTWTFWCRGAKRPGCETTCNLPVLLTDLARPPLFEVRRTGKVVHTFWSNSAHF